MGRTLVWAIRGGVDADFPEEAPMYYRVLIVNNYVEITLEPIDGDDHAILYVDDVLVQTYPLEGEGLTFVKALAAKLGFLREEDTVEVQVPA